MSSDLLSIARSGARAARVSLDLAANNIANAASEGYVRRTASLTEVVASGTVGGSSELTLAGVRIGGVVRHADAFRQAEVRRTGADLSRADSELAGLTDIESALEQSGLHDGLVGFEAALKRLSADPVDPALRTATIEQARTLTSAFNLAARDLDATGQGLSATAADGVSDVNRLGGELARINERLARAADFNTDRSALLDQRDHLLEQLSAHAGIATAFASDGTVEVRLGDAAGPQLVSGFSAAPLAMTTAANGTISFTVGGNPASLATGGLAGTAQALTTLAGTRSGLDTLAAGLIAAVNGAQAGGAALDGSAGQPLLSGTGAGDIALAFEDGALLATAPAGSPAGSRDGANLAALRTALAGSDPAGQASTLMSGVSSAIAGRKVTRDALDAIAGGARSALDAGSAVDLDQEAVNLVRFQQAFQASGRVMQVASDLFDTILAIR